MSNGLLFSGIKIFMKFFNRQSPIKTSNDTIGIAIIIPAIACIQPSIS